VRRAEREREESRQTVTMAPAAPVALAPTPLRTDAEGVRPVDTAQARDDINSRVVDKLREAHARSQAEGYFQSHPHSQMFTAGSLAADEASLAANYMRLVFGGTGGDPDRFATHRAYNHATKQIAEAATLRDASTLHSLDPGAFASSTPTSKDDLLAAFAAQRQYYKGRIDSDAERALKQRVTHRMRHTTFYGRERSGDGMSSTRYHPLVGQLGKPEFRPSVPADFHPWAFQSSRTFAPTEEGGEVPLSFAKEFDDDPRSVRVHEVLPKTIADPVPSAHDLGAFAGNDVDRYASGRDPEPQFAALFEDRVHRRWFA
jgi:hypothetical protein